MCNCQSLNLHMKHAIPATASTIPKEKGHSTQHATKRSNLPDDKGNKGPMTVASKDCFDRSIRSRGQAPAACLLKHSLAIRQWQHRNRHCLPGGAPCVNPWHFCSECHTCLPYVAYRRNRPCQLTKPRLSVGSALSICALSSMLQLGQNKRISPAKGFVQVLARYSYYETACPKYLGRTLSSTQQSK